MVLTIVLIAAGSFIAGGLFGYKVKAYFVAKEQKAVAGLKSDLTNIAGKI